MNANRTKQRRRTATNWTMDGMPIEGGFSVASADVCPECGSADGCDCQVTASRGRTASRRTAEDEGKKCPKCGSKNTDQSSLGDWDCYDCGATFGKQYDASRKAGLSPDQYEWYVEPDEEPGELVLMLIDPDTEEVLDSMGGIDVEHDISDHGNVNYGVDQDRYLSQLAQEMADAITAKRTASFDPETDWDKKPRYCGMCGYDDMWATGDDCPACHNGGPGRRDGGDGEPWFEDRPIEEQERIKADYAKSKEPGPMFGARIKRAGYDFVVAMPKAAGWGDDGEWEEPSGPAWSMPYGGLEPPQMTEGEQYIGHFVCDPVDCGMDHTPYDLIVTLVSHNGDRATLREQDGSEFEIYTYTPPDGEGRWSFGSDADPVWFSPGTYASRKSAGWDAPPGSRVQFRDAEELVPDDEDGVLSVYDLPSNPGQWGWEYKNIGESATYSDNRAYNSDTEAQAAAESWLTSRLASSKQPTVSSLGNADLFEAHTDAYSKWVTATSEGNVREAGKLRQLFAELDAELAGRGLVEAYQQVVPVKLYIELANTAAEHPGSLTWYALDAGGSSVGEMVLTEKVGPRSHFEIHALRELEPGTAQWLLSRLADHSPDAIVNVRQLTPGERELFNGWIAGVSSVELNGGLHQLGAVD